MLGKASIAMNRFLNGNARIGFRGGNGQRGPFLGCQKRNLSPVPVDSEDENCEYDDDHNFEYDDARVEKENSK